MRGRHGDNSGDIVVWKERDRDYPTHRMAENDDGGVGGVERQDIVNGLGRVLPLRLQGSAVKSREVLIEFDYGSVSARRSCDLSEAHTCKEVEGLVLH